MSATSWMGRLESDHVGELLHQLGDVVADRLCGHHSACPHPDLDETLLVGLDARPQVRRKWHLERGHSTCVSVGDLAHGHDLGNRVDDGRDHAVVDPPRRRSSAGRDVLGAHQPLLHADVGEDRLAGRVADRPDVRHTRAQGVVHADALGRVLDAETVEVARSAEGARGAESDVIDQHDEHVRRAVRRPERRDRRERVGIAAVLFGIDGRRSRPLQHRRGDGALRGPARRYGRPTSPPSSVSTRVTACRRCSSSCAEVARWYR
jgi:hypothetical protein